MFVFSSRKLLILLNEILVIEGNTLFKKRISCLEKSFFLNVMTIVVSCLEDFKLETRFVFLS